MGPLQLNFTYWQPNVTGVTPPPADGLTADDDTTILTADDGSTVLTPDA